MESLPLFYYHATHDNMHTKEGVYTFVRITQLCIRVMSKEETCLPHTYHSMSHHNIMY